MAERRSRQVAIAGAGVAGLTAALAFAQRGASVHVFEQATRIEEIGAGLQLSPNATRILDRLGVMVPLRPACVRPEAVVLRSARSLEELARVPLGAAAERHWGAPYLVAHRADLQKALLDCISAEPAIKVTTGAAVRDFAFHPQGLTLSIDRAGGIVETSADLLIGADGVWSTLRQHRRNDSGASRFTGSIAWRRTMRADDQDTAPLRDLGAMDVVTVFLHPRFHLVAYPLRGGAAINLAAFTAGTEMSRRWSNAGSIDPLIKALRRASPKLHDLALREDAWRAWPVHAVAARGRWTDTRGLALIGDAAHAMTPFAAQGAAMAIEDAWTLAASVAGGEALSRWEAARRSRVSRVRRRGRLNELAWHAAGPIALARDAMLRSRPPEKLAADMDWLYGWQAPE